MRTNIRMRFDALISIIGFANGPQKLSLVPSLMGNSTVWISECEDLRAGKGEAIVYNFNTQEIEIITSEWRKTLEEFQVGKGDLYDKFLDEMQNFVWRVPPKHWFIPQKPKQLLLPPFGDQNPSLVQGYEQLTRSLRT